jgi:transcription antitermination protein NusB
LNTKTAGREIAFLALCHIAQSEKSNPDKLILAATRTLRDFAKQRLKKVRGELKNLGEFFFNEALTLKEDKVREINFDEIHQQVCKLEEAAFTLEESLDLPELLNHSTDAYQFASVLVDSFRQNKEQINQQISETLESNKLKKENKGWKFDRVLSVDKAVLRIACTELLFFSETPGVIVIDEALNLAEKYGSDDSPKFVNGVLADIFAEQQKPKTPSQPTPQPEEKVVEEESEITRAEASTLAPTESQ